MSSHNFMFHELQVFVNYKNIKNTYLRIDNDGNVCINTNKRNSLGYIQQLVQNNYPKLLKKIRRRQQKIKDSALTTVDSDSFLLWGKIHQLQNNSLPDLTIFNCQSATKISSLDKMLNSEAKYVFELLLKECYLPFAKLGYSLPRLSVKKMKTRWGSYSAKTHRIHLNQILVHLDVKYSQYVIIHELCHLIEMNHSVRFYALMDIYEPNWRELRVALNRYSDLLSR